MSTWGCTHHYISKVNIFLEALTDYSKDQRTLKNKDKEFDSLPFNIHSVSELLINIVELLVVIIEVNFR